MSSRGRGARRALAAAVVTSALGLGAAQAQAQAVTRYATPTGGATTGDCTSQAAPCTLPRAAEVCGRNEVLDARAGSYVLADALPLGPCALIRTPTDAGVVELSRSTPGPVVTGLAYFPAAVERPARLQDVHVRGDVVGATGGGRVLGLVARDVVVDGSFSLDGFTAVLVVEGRGLQVLGNAVVRSSFGGEVRGTAPLRVAGTLELSSTNGTTFAVEDASAQRVVVPPPSTGAGALTLGAGRLRAAEPIVLERSVTIGATAELEAPVVELRTGSFLALRGVVRGDLVTSGVLRLDAASGASVRGALTLRAGASTEVEGVRTGATLADPVLSVDGAATLSGAASLVDVSQDRDGTTLSPFQRLVVVKAGTRAGRVTVPDGADHAPLHLPTSLVLTRGPEVEVEPVITRTGDVATVAPGTWVGRPEPVVTRQWQRCDGPACADVEGATGTTYAVTDADRGRDLRVVESAASADRRATTTSARVAVPPAPAPLAPSAPAPPAPVAPAPVTGPCANGADDDGDGFVDRADPQCAAGRGTEGPRDNPLLACGGRSVLLTDVLPASRGRVRLAGLADPAFVGRPVTLRSADGARVATTTLRPGGTFAATARAPQGRFVAEVAGVRSLPTRVQRQTVDARVVRRGGRVGLTARVTARRSAGAVVELLVRDGACGAYRRVASARLPASGRFTLLAPAGARVLRARVRLPGGRTTFSLPRTA